jgi:uncharacterized phosphosugar-binding protein
VADFIETYLNGVADLLHSILQDSSPAIHEAAQSVAEAITRGGNFLLFGSGHSALIAKDAAYRAGGLAPTLTIDDVADGDAERLEGLGKFILARYDLRPESVIAVISNSGINPVPIEIAQIAKDAGLKVIAITSLTHSRAVTSRHSSGKKLYELADIVIDTHSPPGDASITLSGSPYKSGATSTIAGSAIVQSITVQAAGLLAERGIDPPIWVSANLPDGDAHNKALLERYRPSLVRHQMAQLPGGKHA